MTGDTVSPATTVSPPTHVRFVAYITNNGAFHCFSRPQLRTPSGGIREARDLDYRGVIVKSRGQYQLSMRDGVTAVFTHKSAAIAAMRMADART